ncbi:ecdysone oxidase-like [Bicyclus anynana]|uniref:Ecdysone oxidase-like n=1 Tax=Bicyclus anynana TaxID=110368 RepID=A0A6J1NLR8_BICAN|nr:ecdysone oxidase-like [Bicyclus anynana]
MAFDGIVTVQRALSVVALLLSSYLFPEQTQVRDYHKYDFIVVGGGAAGGAAADRLSECGRYDVLVVEAGGDPPTESVLPGLFSFLPHSKYEWNFTSVNDSEYLKESHGIGALGLTSGRMLGGGSSINYMIYARGCPGDFDSWADDTKDDRWNYDNVLPYFRKSERLESSEILYSADGFYHGTDGFLGITREGRPDTARYLDAFKEAGHKILNDANGRDNIGFTLPQYMISGGMRQSSAYVNLGAHKDRTNLHVLKNSLVVEVIFDSDNNAIGVKVVTDDNRVITVLANREVILSAGAFNTPKLLMLSGVGPKQHLQSLGIKVRSDLPVGKNLQNHVLSLVSFKMENSTAKSAPQDPHEMPFPIVLGYGRVDESQTCPEYQVFNFIIPNDSEAPFDLCSFNLGFTEPICQGFLDAVKGRNTLLATITVLHPESKGQVTLRSTDPFDPPLIEPRILSEERDLDAFTSYLQDYLRVLNTTYFRSVNAEVVELDLPGCKSHEFGSRAYWKCYLRYMNGGMFHDVGTCSMGAVLDSELRVLGVRRLRVADTSALPSLPSGNTNAAAVLVAERLADLLKRDHPVEFVPKGGCDADSGYVSTIYCYVNQYFGW